MTPQEESRKQFDGKKSVHSVNNTIRARARRFIFIVTVTVLGLATVCSTFAALSMIKEYMNGEILFIYWMAVWWTHVITFVCMTYLESTKAGKSFCGKVAVCVLVGVNIFLAFIGSCGCGAVAGGAFGKWLIYWNTMWVFLDKWPVTAIPVGAVFTLPAVPMALLGAMAIHFGSLFVAIGRISSLMESKPVKDKKRKNEGGSLVSKSNLKTCVPNKYSFGDHESNLTRPRLDITTAHPVR
eukprot:CAMPEP_0201607078 /NCGR_PEP_ID=MMETSP0492-20130828/6316_1 /ASSEMBLY_ACC=CAM_ASM_000837 /TAXON_ID=420259 /ORGANISM="Thalassiosira gravida, Strain GMp14c1" /LENGTH=239 /DNA_ID=CAMNT_0048071613 /DNA_START=495 /DNA_END=1214 /DNA_ORIENTATION=-